MSELPAQENPVLIVPWFWIGDFVRVHSVVSLLRAERPLRPVDMLATPLTAPLADYMPGVRKAVISDLPRRRIAFVRQRKLGDRLRQEQYAQAIIMPRTWKSAFAPWLAGIPIRTGFTGEMRYGLINDMRPGERALPRMIDQMGMLALPKGAGLPSRWPSPKLDVPAQDIAAWRATRGLVPDGRPAVTFAPGAIGAGKAWPVAHYAELARLLTKEGIAIWVVGGPSEKMPAQEIARAGGELVRDLTGHDLRDAILALGGADAAVTNDSGLMHVAAAIGTPTIAIFGPTSSWHWRPLNRLAAILEPPIDAELAARVRTEGNRAVAHRVTADVLPSSVADSVRSALAMKRN